MFTGSFTEVNPKIWTFSAFLYIFETKRLEGIFLKSLYVIFIMYRVFSHDVTAAILVSQNNETAAMLVS